jgi:ribonuclease Z
MSERNLNPGNYQNLQLGDAKIDFMAFTVAGFASYVAAPQFDLCFDLGFCPVGLLGINNIFLSHVHLDHMAGLPMYLAQRHMRSQPLAKVYVPEESRGALLEALSSIERLQNGSVPVEQIVYGVKAGCKLPLSKNLHVETFEVDHVLPSLGYSVIETKNKLKKELAGKPWPELKEILDRGEKIGDVVEKRLVTYVGDSTVETYKKNRDIIANSEILFLEITHLEQKADRDESKKYGHTNLPAFLEFYNNDKEIFNNVKQLVFKHFSMRSSQDEIETALAKHLPEELKNKSIYNL